MPETAVNVIPFSSVRGMEDVKRALKCAAADEGIQGVLIKGPTGTAKSVLVRSFAGILDREMVNVPVNASYEQLFGGLDVERAVSDGERGLSAGLMHRADGNILYLDNVNLFDRRMLSTLLECVAAGRVAVEREGISAEYGCRTTVIATMDPAEGTLPDDIADRFGICVQTYTSQDAEVRSGIASLGLEFGTSPETVRGTYAAMDAEAAEDIRWARMSLDRVDLTREDIEGIVGICDGLGVRGHRGDIAVARTSRALAALDGRLSVTDRDIEDAAVMCLLHRRGTERREGKKKRKEAEKEEREENATSEVTPEHRTDAPEDPEEDGTEGEKDAEEVRGTAAAVRERLDDMDALETIRLDRLAGIGRRRDAVSGTGRYRGSRLPRGRPKDVAFDATVRAAAPYQRMRGNNGLSVSIEKQDIRERIRVRRERSSFLFAVDVSGSQVSGGRMEVIKNAAKAMLADGYARRDKVALMTFRYRDVRIAVPFTRSVEEVFDALDGTLTGGATPLGEALLMIRSYLSSRARKEPDERRYVIMITDGEPTDSVVRRADPAAELREIAAVMDIPGTEWVIVDTDVSGGTYGRELADMLRAEYHRLDDLGS